MIVYLLRHGIAMDLGERGVTCDEDRMLSAEGVRKTGRALRGLAALECNPQTIFSSPLVRAVETAELAAAALDCPVAFTDLLVPEADPHRTIAWLGTLSQDSLMLVGHMPQLAALAGLIAAAVLGAVGLSLLAVLLGVLVAFAVALSPIWIPVLVIVGLVKLFRTKEPNVVTA